MASKYDSYWRSMLPALKGLLLEADRRGDGGPLDVSRVQGYGDRGAWHGVVSLSRDGVREGEMAHARSLGNVILQSGLMKLCGDHAFRLSISKDLRLTALRLEGGTAEKETPAAAGVGYEAGERVGEGVTGTAYRPRERERRFLEILAGIPGEAWEQICREEPEWKVMEPFLDRYGFGPFAVLMLATGLNDYQLKGRAEVAYWPPIGRLLAPLGLPSSPEGFINVLEPFYRNERYASDKVRRLHKFLSSPLARQLWGLEPGQASRIFPYIWRELAKVMNQKPQDKTISFAMKCLGLSLLMKGISSFDFNHIPIPVDVRVVGFSEKAGLCLKGDQPESIRKLWGRMLTMLQGYHPSLTMIHLDSLVWQAAAMDERRMQDYFERLGAPEAGARLCAFLREGQAPASPAGERARRPASKAEDGGTSGEGGVICFIPCCGSKQATGKIVRPELCMDRDALPRTWEKLAAGRRGMEYCLDGGSQKTTALYLYTGSPYEVFATDKDKIAGLIQEGGLRLLIISAGYGLLDALEPALNYDAVLQGKVAAHWRQNGLADVIADLLLQQKPAGVYGFFAGKWDWPSPGSKYRYFFTEGVKTALRKGLAAQAGCFYRMEGQGVKAILGGLGRTFRALLEAGFEQGYIKGFPNEGMQDGSVKIGFERIVP